MVPLVRRVRPTINDRRSMPKSECIRMAVAVGLHPKAGALPDASPDTESVPLGSVLGTVPERRYSSTGNRLA
jgi:hypothetical protein